MNKKQVKLYERLTDSLDCRYNIEYDDSVSANKYLLFEIIYNKIVVARLSMTGGHISNKVDVHCLYELMNKISDIFWHKQMDICIIKESA